MNPKLQQATIAGIAGTAVMTMITFVAPYMGLPKMNPAEMLAGLLGAPVIVGWIMHFMIGVIFALAYTFFAARLLKKIANKIVKGAVFGFAVFVFAQIMMAIMGALMGGMASPEGSMILMMIGSIIGHVVYGVVVALFVKDNTAK